MRDADPDANPGASLDASLVAAREAVDVLLRQRTAPLLGRPWSFSGVAVHPVRDAVAAVAEVRDEPLGAARTVLTLVEDGRTTELREGWMPVWSPDGSVLAHVVADGLQLGELVRPLTGTVDRLAWKADGSALLVVLAEPGSELSGGAGSGLLPGAEAWHPDVQSTDGDAAWRRLVVVDARTGALTPVGRRQLNVWDACWAGEQVLAVCSDGSSTESAWYTADLRLLDPASGEDRVVVTPETQLGPLAASPSGRRVAWVESISSDRGLMCGDLHLLDLETGDRRRLAEGLDVSDVAFVGEGQLGVAGLDSLTTRVALVSTDGDVQPLWESLTATAAGWGPSASFRADGAAFYAVGYDSAPQLLLVRPDAEPVTLHTVLDAPQLLLGTTRVHRWSAPDGWEVEGWLHLPEGEGPHPCVVVVHGGPVSHYRAHWAAQAVLRPLLLERGYAVLLPNVRGSNGRGQEFARAVVGDMGGADAQDVLAGVASLVDAGVVDPARVGITGGSYGGFLSAWLPTQTDAFAASVSLHPITDWAHQHGASCIPSWDELFLDGKPYARDGQYVARSPITHVAACRTPMLLVAGALDRATPPGQALAMQRALAAHGVASACVTYPLAAHGARDLASNSDVSARTLAWFERHMPARPTSQP